MSRATSRLHSIVRQMSVSASQSSTSSSSLTKLKQFSACELSDALIKLGVPHGGHIPDVRRVTSYEGSVEERICGPAYTVKMVYASDKEAPKPEKHFVDTVVDGSVVVIDAPPDVKNAVWGGLMTAGALSRGALGLVISGRCRDLLEHNSMRFPIFSRGTSTLGQSPFTRPSVVQVPVTISPQYVNQQQNTESGYVFPAVTIHPGDFITADIDGVVCVPKDLVDEVVKVAEKGREVDAKCMEDIKAGKGVQESFKKHRAK